MSKIIASAAIRGAHKYVREAERELNKLTKEKGSDYKVAYPNTAYYLPFIYAILGLKVENLEGTREALKEAKNLLPPLPSDKLWLPYLGDALDAGVATLIAEEIIEALKYARGEKPEGIWLGFTDDAILRTQGIKLVDGRMPGFAACVGALPTNEEAVKLARTLQEKSILVFMASSSNGTSMAEQLAEEGIEMNWDTFLVPYGKDTSAAIHALNFAVRSAMTFGGLKPGNLDKAREILLYNKRRVHAFVLALGQDKGTPKDQLITDEKYATAAGAINFGFPVISDVDLPQILPTGICTYEHVVSGIPRETIVAKAIEVRGLEIKVTKIDIPVPYGAGFEGERVRKEEMQVQFGGKYSQAFELLRGASMEEVEDGKIELIGPDIDQVQEGAAMPLGILVQVAGRKFQEDFESVLERRIHEFISCANGIFHMGQRAIAWIRISKEAFQKGFRLKHLGEILVAKLHDEFSKLVDKVQVTIITDEEKLKEPLEETRRIFHDRDERLAGMTDENVDTLYSCILCVPKGEEIILPNGSFQSVENLFDEASCDSVLSLNSHDFQSQPIEEFFLNPAPSSLLRITLSNGNSLCLTPNHRVLIDGEKALEWVKASELEPGDWLVSPLTTMVDGETSSDPWVIDFLPPSEVKVYNEETLSLLKNSILKKYGTIGQAYKELGIGHQKLYQALRIGGTISRRRLTLREVRLICEKVGIPWSEFKTKIREVGIGKRCRLKKAVLDEEILYLAGLVASDGCIIKRGKSTYVQFTNTEEVLVDRFSQVVRSWLGISPKTYSVKPAISVSKGVEVRGRKKVFVSHVHHPLLGQILMGLGIRKEEGWNGEIISSLSPELVACFLRGLFDGDGHVTNEHILISTGKYKEAQHIFLLLKKLGIPSYITETTRGYQVGTRSYLDIEKFRSLISSHHPGKLQKMQRVKSHRDINHVIRTNTVPRCCGKLIDNLITKYQASLQITKVSLDYKTVKNWAKGRHRISREKLELLLSDLRDVVDPSDLHYRELLAWYNSRASFERIKKIETIKYAEEEVYNFSVKDTHNYLVNGIVVKNCQSYAPNHVCIVTPQRLGLCGAYTWLDCKASYELNPHGPNEPVKKGRCLNEVKGQWEGINEYLVQKSNGNLERFNAYSIIEDPMTSCGCFECITVVLPETNGVMIVNREFTGMTPVGMTFSTMAGQVGGGVQTPGFIGMGKMYITSQKFISAEGGIKRVVWMPQELKEEIGERVKIRLKEIGEADLMDKIATDKEATTSEELLKFLQDKKHPALSMEPIM